MSNKIENIFKEKFESFESAPSAGLFEAIQAKRKKKKRAIWMWSAAATLLLSTGIGFSLMKDLPNNTTDVDTTPVVNVETPLENENSKSKITLQEKDLVEKSSNTELQLDRDLAVSDKVTTPNTSKEGVAFDKPSSKTPVIPNLGKPDSPISNQDLADLFTKIASKNKDADISKAKVFTKHGESEVDIITEVQLQEVKDNSSSNIQESTPPLQDVVKTTHPDTQSVSTTPPTHKLVKLSRWSIEATGALGLGGRSISGSQDYVSLRNGTESARISNAFSLSGIFQLNPSWNIQSGIILVNRNESFDHSTEDQVQYIQRDEQRTETVIHPVLGEIEREYTVTVTDTLTTAGNATNANNTYSVLSIPVVVEKELWTGKKWSIISKGGAMVSIYSSSQGNIINAENQVNSLSSSGTRAIGTYTGVFGLGTIFKASDRVSVVIYPQVNFGINSTFEDGVAFKQRDMGVYSHFGLRVRL